MRNKLLIPFMLIALVFLSAACGSPKVQGNAPTPQMAANLGLARKGLSPSEVDLPCTQPDAEAKLAVVSCRIFRHMGETAHLVGEIENKGDTALGKLEIKAEGWSSEGQVMDSKTDQAYFDPVMPGKRTPFRIFLDARDVAKVELTVSGQPVSETPAASLEVTNVTVSEPASGYTHLRGEVKNPGSDAVDGILVAVLRDESGQVVEVHRQSLLQPIPAGTSTFDVLALHRDAKTAEVSIFPK